MASPSSPRGTSEGLASKYQAASSCIKTLYFIMQTIERKVGGGEGMEGLYGSVTRTGMHKVLDCLISKCGLDSDSHFVDIGAGLGRPLLHALVHPGVASGFGIELDSIKCQKAEAFLERTVQDLARRVHGLDIPIPLVQCSSVESVSTLDPATHAYSFWEGVPAEGRYAFGRLFSQSSTLQSVAVVQRAMRNPITEMEEFGFGTLALEASFPVSMSGSGRNFTAYVFSRTQPAPPRLPHTPAAADKRRQSIESAETPVLLPAVGPETGRCQHAERSRANRRAEANIELQISTPPVTAHKSRLAATATPGSASRTAICLTPKSAGISGPPRRIRQHPVSCQPAGLQNEGKAVPAQQRVEAAASLQADKEKTLGRSGPIQQQTRKSSRLAGRVAPPQAAAPRNVASRKSPAKSATTLEAAGMRSRRGVGAGAARKTAAVRKLQIEPKGLASSAISS